MHLALFLSHVKFWTWLANAWFVTCLDTLGVSRIRTSVSCNAREVSAVNTLLSAARAAYGNNVCPNVTKNKRLNYVIDIDRPAACQMLTGPKIFVPLSPKLVGKVPTNLQGIDLVDIHAGQEPTQRNICRCGARVFLGNFEYMIGLPMSSEASGHSWLSYRMATNVGGTKR